MFIGVALNPLYNFTMDKIPVMLADVAYGDIQLFFCAYHTRRLTLSCGDRKFEAMIDNNARLNVIMVYDDNHEVIHVNDPSAVMRFVNSKLSHDILDHHIFKNARASLMKKQKNVPSRLRMCFM